RFKNLIYVSVCVLFISSCDYEYETEDMMVGSINSKTKLRDMLISNPWLVINSNNTFPATEGNTLYFYMDMKYNVVNNASGVSTILYYRINEPDIMQPKTTLVFGGQEYNVNVLQKNVLLLTSTFGNYEVRLIAVK
ncbi:MAG: hypothetical protein ACK574_01955, partial [Bacteroidota bacterium]